jgi:hypothetical protein
MAKQAVLARTDLEPIDRLGAADERARLTQEIDSLRARLADAESVNDELTTLRDEREIIRTRVSEMLTHLEGLAV